MPRFVTIPLISGTDIIISVDHIVQIIPRSDSECVIATITDQLTAKIPHSRLAEILESQDV